MDSFRFIVLTPAGTNNPSIAIAACRAGEWGILDLEYCRDPETARVAIERLAKYSKNNCGIKLDSSAVPFFSAVTEGLPEPVQIVLLTASDPEALPGQVDALHKRKRTVLLEVTSPDEAHLGQEIGVDGLIAKGHEAGGWVGVETTFVLLQHIRQRVGLPIWAQGGIGLHSAAACVAAGATGLVLNDQLLLTQESPLTDSIKTVLSRMDGSETICIGGELGLALRVFQSPVTRGVDDLRRRAAALEQDPRPKREIQDAWRQVILSRVGWNPSEGMICVLGQEAVFASRLAERFGTVGGILQGMKKSIDSHLSAARRLKPLNQNAPLAQSHGTRYPIVQGPMTRVSDRADFALRVAEAGGLPFLALALMRAPEVKALLEETHRLLKDRPWGVGILGFVPFDLRQEQLEVVKSYRPDYALIAGGRPDQARSLEAEKIKTYLHVPSPGLLRMFLEEGARRFVFEGRECGGHVGPRSSFVLWDTMIDLLLEFLPPGADSDACHVLFAGGIHDSLSAAMVAALAAPLAEKGIRIGVLMGTAYLFTEESVSSGAIQRGFQEEAIRCERTVLLETGPGHATRCSDTPFAKTFLEEKHRLLSEKRSHEEIRDSLENLNLGRLRIASKGIIRNPQYGQDPNAPRYLTIEEEAQRTQGMYMIGQVAALRDRTCTIAELHHEVSVRGMERLSPSDQKSIVTVNRIPKERPSNVAIVGIGCLLPKAPDIGTFWENVLGRVDAITEVPKNRWDVSRYFDSDPKSRDKIYSRWGGFLDEVAFDPMQYGMPPNSLKSIEPLQLLTLEVVRQALADAGYGVPSVNLTGRPFAQERTSVVLGVGGGIADLGQQYALRSGLPMFLDNLPADLWNRLPEWSEDSFAGILLNVAAGRVANRFDLGGTNFTVDAACASSLAAIYLAVRELESGDSDMVIAGGADTVQNPFAYLCFSKTQALSPRGRCRTFDERADGIVISEGLAAVVLKRLEDAERDGDRIYAVIKAVGSSSDGRDKGLTAPRPEGQIRALDRAYAKAGFSPATVGLIEAHGTGTVAGDQAEGQSLIRVFASAGAPPQSLAIGSLKSMIGHTKCSAGVAGLLKIALALHQKVLPPTINVEKPNPKVFYSESPLYVNSETRPWLAPADHPRRAGVSSFGFGGTNFHAVLEEYTGNYLDSPATAVTCRLPTELFYWVGESKKDLEQELDRIEHALSQGAAPELHELAFAVWKLSRSRLQSGKGYNVRLAIVASSLEDLRYKLQTARKSWATDPQGVYIGDLAAGNPGKVAFLFPGQGSQYPDMLRDLAVQFPEVRDRFEVADRTLAGRFPKPLSSYVYPCPRFNQEEEKRAQAALTATNIAQPALGAAGVGLHRLLQRLGIQPEMAAGHSYGEYIALHAAGVFDEETLFQLSETRGRMMIEAAEGRDLGTMAAVEANAETLRKIISSIEGVSIANLNGPRQTILSGSKDSIAQAIEQLKAQGVVARPIPVACAFHSPLVAPARDRFANYLRTLSCAEPRFQVYSNTTGTSHPQTPKSIIECLADHLVRPVEFIREIEAMYEAGARVFVEVGPRNVLTGLTRGILGDRPHLAIATDIPERDGRIQIQHALAQLASQGVSVNLDRLFEGRTRQSLDLSSLESSSKPKPLPPTTWMISGGGIRKLSEAKETPKPPILLRDVNPQTSAMLNREGDGTAFLMSGPSPTLHETPIPAVGLNNASTVSDIDPVLIGFQDLMSRFLETQKQVMLTYLQVSPGNPSIAPPIPTTVTQRADSPLATIPGLTPHRDVPPVSSSAVPKPSVGSEVSAAPPAPDVSNADQTVLTDMLVRLVAERTGYPPEMLGLDLNLEADLGIDSIKRVEILGAFRRKLGTENERRLSQAMERFTGIKTLRGLIEVTAGVLSARPEPESTAPIPSVPELESATRPASLSVPRFLLRTTRMPLDKETVPPVSGCRILITDDGRGTADALGSMLARAGAEIVIVVHGPCLKPVGEHRYEANLADPSEVDALIHEIHRRHGSITGILHLLPLREAPSFDRLGFDDWRDRIRVEIKSLFYLVKASAADLKTAGRSGAAWVIGATSMGNIFGTAGASPFESPHHGGVAGLIKVLALEWPGVLCKVIDFDPSEAAQAIASRILEEMGSQDGITEIGYRGKDRMVLRAYSAELNPASGSGIQLGSDAVVMITGGACGISAEIAFELASQCRPTLILVGRTPMPADTESPELQGVTEPAVLKTALIERMRRSDGAVTPAKIEAAYAWLFREREIRTNIAALRSTGAKVEYLQADVRDTASIQALVDGIYQRHGRLDGVISAAGIIEDKLVEDKTPESLDRVIDTKVDGAFNLIRAVRPESLKFFVFFASVAGRFANRGQGDYGAANEILNKLALCLDRTWGARVISLNWGPWESGMALPEVQRQFAERGVQVIPPKLGRTAFWRELIYGPKGNVEVVLGDGPWKTAASPDRNRASLPLLEGFSLSPGHAGALEGVRVLDPNRDLFLMDHQIDGKPVLPFAFALEFMVEAVQAAWPEWQVVGVRDIRLFKGIIIDNGPKRVRLSVRSRTEPAQERLGLDVVVTMTDAENPALAYYQGTVELSDRLPEPPEVDFSLDEIGAYPKTVEQAYEDWLFHGPLFQHIEVIEGASNEAIVARLRPSAPGECIQGAEAPWLIDPILVDCGPQLVILWARAFKDMTPLPSRFERYIRYGSAAGGRVRCVVRVLPDSDDSSAHADVYFFDDGGGLIGQIKGMETVGSKALNRLAGDQAAQRRVP